MLKKNTTTKKLSEKLAQEYNYEPKDFLLARWKPNLIRRLSEESLLKYPKQLFAYNISNEYGHDCTLRFLDGVFLNGIDYFNYCVMPTHKDDMAEFFNLTDEDMNNIISEIDEKRKELFYDWPKELH